jgi:hypothetical protein
MNRSSRSIASRRAFAAKNGFNDAIQLFFQIASGLGLGCQADFW